MKFYLWNLYTLITILLFSGNAFSQSCSNWITGDSSDVEVVLNEQKLFLAGGGTDNDQAMAKMLTYTQGGDVLVIRASGSDGYNPYFLEN